MIATITATTYFTNNIVIHRQVPLARAVTLMDHANAIIPPDADLLEVRSPSQIMLVPAVIIFSVDKAFVPHVPMPTKAGVYRRDRGMCAYCGRPISIEDASMDHVIPQSQDGPAPGTTWSMPAGAVTRRRPIERLSRPACRCASSPSHQRCAFDRNKWFSVFTRILVTRGYLPGS